MRVRSYSHKLNTSHTGRAPHGSSGGMAYIQPPDPFDFRNPDDWPRWRRRYQQFCEAYGLSDESASKQISTFLYCLGEEAESVLASMNATAEDRRDFDRTIARFDAYFKVRKSVIYERARFNRKNQQSAETAEQYIMALSPEFWSGEFWSGGPKFSVENWSGRTDFFGKNGPPLENWSEQWSVHKRFSYKRLLRIKHPVQCLLT